MWGDVGRLRTSDWSRRRASTCRSHGCKHSLAQMAEVAWSVATQPPHEP